MRFYLELLFLAFGLTAAIMVLILIGYRDEVTRQGEEKEERKNAPEAFYEVTKCSRQSRR